MIKGWIRATLIDFPGEIATTLFCGGCNFRCPICHNKDLVLNHESLPDYSEDTIFNFLTEHKGKITGVAISGGEPCMSTGLVPFLQKIRGMGFKVKLDTNGYFPDILGQIIEGDWVDYVAVDIKASPEKYPLLCGLKHMDMGRINASIDLLQQDHVMYEFRTTVVPGLTTLEEIDVITDWIQGAKRYALQQFQPHGCLDADYDKLIPYSPDILLQMKEIAQKKIQEVWIKGI